MPNVLRESSGILTFNGSTVWSHNDSGGEPKLYEIDVQSGAIIRIVTLDGATNKDWEDLTKDDRNNVYVGDFGNNRESRRNLCIYKIADPTLLPPSATAPTQRIGFKYADQKDFPPLKNNRNFDCEAFIFYRDSLYLFTKNHSTPYNGYTKLYRLPADEGDYTAEPIDSFRTGRNKISSFVTAAALSPDNKKLALLSSDKVYIFSDWKGANFFKGKLKIIPLGTLTQKEGVCFINNHQLWISDEKHKLLNGGNLYVIDVE
jgi:hypothetical protein